MPRLILGVRRIKKLYLCLILANLISCGGGSSSSSVLPVIDLGDALPDISTFPDVSWESYVPADVNVSKDGIDQALDYAFETGRNTQGVRVIRLREAEQVVDVEPVAEGEEGEEGELPEPQEPPTN